MVHHDEYGGRGFAKDSRLVRFVDHFRLIGISARLLAGRRFWIAPLLPLLWSAFQAIRLIAGWQEKSFVAASAQNTLIGLPLTVLALGLGVRIIAGEMDRRTLEIAYTVPGGSHWIWIYKLAAAVLMLVLGEALVAVITYAFFIYTTFLLISSSSISLKCVLISS